MGGARVGAVASVTPARTRAGTPIALLNVKLYENVKPLPVDSRFDIRLKGAIGLKYLQITLGHARRGLPNSATVPLTQTSSEVDFDQVLSMFNPPTRQGREPASTIGFGEALAGRGYDINNAIGAFLPLVTDLGPVARNLSSRSTDLAGFFHGLESYTAALTPVAATNATLFTNLNTTFRALAGVARPYFQDTISQTPPTFEATIGDTPVIQPFLTDTASLLHQFRPGFATLYAERAGARRHVRDRHQPLPSTADLDQQARSCCRARWANTAPIPSSRAARPAAADAGPSAPAAVVPDAGAGTVQLRDAVPAQHLQPALRARYAGHVPAIRPDRDHARRGESRHSRPAACSPAPRRP